MAFNLDDYATVPERIAQAKDLYPDGRFQSRIIELPESFAGQFLAVEARFYRTADDPAPAIGLAWEPVPGKTPYTKDSELMNAETSAWGRALIAAFAADAKKGIASREEVQARQSEERPRNRSGPQQRTPRTEKGVTVTEPSDKPVEAPRNDSNGNGGETVGRIRSELLERVKGDNAKARMMWRLTLETFGLSTSDPIPADMLEPIETALKAMPV